MGEGSNLFAFILSLHVVSGFISLVVAPLAMLTKKGSSTHRMWGKIYFGGMAMVCLTALIRAIYKPNPFLLMISVFSFYLVASGYRAIFLKGLHKDQPADVIDWFVNVVAGVFSISLLVWGFQQNAVGLMILSFCFGLIGLLLVVGKLRSFIVRPKDRNHWLYSHMSLMLASYISTVTAFSVVNLDFIPGPGIIRWLWPTIIGSPLISIWVRHYRKKIGAKKRSTLEKEDD